MSKRHAALLALLIAAPAHANDSTAQAGAGGLVLVPSYVKMAKEVLKISKDRIDIDYEFANETDHPITSLVAFPLPLLEDYDNDFLVIPPVEDQPENFVAFTVTVDGKKVEPKLEQRATMAGVDITAELKADNLPVNVFYAKDARKAFEALPKERKEFYSRRGVALFNDDGTVDGLALSVSTNFYWEQTFPAKSTVKVHHSYKPVYGQGFLSKGSLEGEERQRLAKTYCTDKGFEAAVKPLVTTKPTKDNPDGSKLAVEMRVDYILKTARNWNGTIGDFDLTIEKPNAATILSLCWDGKLEKATPTTFHYHAKDFSADQDISILFVDPTQKVE